MFERNFSFVLACWVMALPFTSTFQFMVNLSVHPATHPHPSIHPSVRPSIHPSIRSKCTGKDTWTPCTMCIARTPTQTYMVGPMWILCGFVGCSVHWFPFGAFVCEHCNSKRATRAFQRKFSERLGSSPHWCLDGGPPHLLAQIARGTQGHSMCCLSSRDAEMKAVLYVLFHLHDFFNVGSWDFS